MADRKIPIRLKTPEDETGNRTDMFPITSSDEVIIADSEEGTTLTEKLNGMITMSTTKPNHACLWLNPMSSEEDTTGVDETP